METKNTQAQEAQSDESQNQVSTNTAEVEEQNEPELSEFEKKALEAIDALKKVEMDEENEALLIFASRDLGEYTRTSVRIVGKGINLKRILYNACKDNPNFEKLLVEVSMREMAEKHGN